MTYFYSIHELANAMWNWREENTPFDLDSNQWEDPAVKQEFIDDTVNAVLDRNPKPLSDLFNEYKEFDENPPEISELYEIQQTLWELAQEKELCENKQCILDKMVEAIRLTSAGGIKYGNNALVELKFIPSIVNENRGDVVRPIFEDGTGVNGYYDVNVDCDSGIAMIMDVVNQFVKKMW